MTGKVVNKPKLTRSIRQECSGFTKNSRSSATTATRISISSDDNWTLAGRKYWSNCIPKDLLVDCSRRVYLRDVDIDDLSLMYDDAHTPMRKMTFKQRWSKTLQYDETNSAIARRICELLKKAKTFGHKNRRRRRRAAGLLNCKNIDATNVHHST